MGRVDAATAFAGHGVRVGVVRNRGRGRVPVPDGTCAVGRRGKAVRRRRRCKEAALSLDDHLLLGVVGVVPVLVRVGRLVGELGGGALVLVV